MKRLEEQPDGYEYELVSVVNPVDEGITVK